MLLFAAMLLTASAANAADRQIDVSSSKVHRIFLPASQSMTVEVNSVLGDILVGNQAIADAQPMTDRTLYIIGRSTGTTSVTMYGEGRRSLGVIEVEVGADIGDMQTAIRQVAPKARINVGSVNGKVRLSGHVADGATLAKILDVAAQYGSEVINAVVIEDSQQVNLEVRVLEASRNAGRDLGVSFRSRGNNNVKFGTGVGAVDKDNVVLGDGGLLSNILSNTSPMGALIANIVDSSIQVDLIIEALEKKGVVRTLAEPNLTTLSGETASFNAGGEVPVRRVEDDEVVIEYKQFGVNLVFTPVVLEGDKINIRLAPEVSELTAFTAQGDPIFSNRKLSTVVELRDGQSFAVGGLLSSTNRKIQEQVPWIGQVPIIGSLFRNTSTQKEEKELVVVVTPRLVRPAAPGQQVATPFDKTRSANDPELFLLGQLEVTKDMIRGYELGKGVVGPYGHMLDVSSKDKMVYVKK
jgi:pilus assembly protein CpaC